MISSPPRYFQDRAYGDGWKRVLMRCIFLVGTALFTDRYVLDGQGDGSSSLIHGAELSSPHGRFCNAREA